MLSALLTLSSVAAASELALYWGQNSAGTETSLANYCQNSPGDIYIISFINNFGSGRNMTMNINGYYEYITGTQLLNAPGLGKDIQTCQSLGKKVFISLGGAVGDYGLDSDSDAEQVASDLWNYFGGGASSIRPFGPDVKLDGFDIDSENNLDAPQYTALVNKLNQLYSLDSSKHYYTSASPQCPFPDASVGNAVANSHLDYLFVQFYNNYCSLSGNSFNFDTWQNFASTQSPNRDVKVLAGLAGSPSAGSGYATVDDIKAKYPALSSSANFGGFSVWDASQANSNIIDGKSLAQQLEAILNPPKAPASTEASTKASSTEASSTGASPTGASTEASTKASASNATFITGVPFVTPVSVTVHVPVTTDVAITTEGSVTSKIPVVTYSVLNTESLVTSRSPVTTEAPVNAAPVATNAVSAVVSAAPVNGTWVHNFAVQYTTVVGTYTTTLPCTTSTTPVGGGAPYETVGQTTVVQTYTSTVPCETPSPMATGPATNAPNAHETSTITFKSTSTVYHQPTDTRPMTTVNGTGYILETSTKTYTTNLCTC